MEPKRQIGLRIKELRQAMGLSQEEVARRADVAASHLSSIELGKENSKIDTLLKLSKALNVELWELLNYGHELSVKELQRKVNQQVKNAKEEDLRLFSKILNAIMK
jgi:transcriptional regulator with XRE-family HTH domain